MQVSERVRCPYIIMILSSRDALFVYRDLRQLRPGRRRVIITEWQDISRLELTFQLYYIRSEPVKSRSSRMYCGLEKSYFTSLWDIEIEPVKSRSFSMPKGE